MAKSHTITLTHDQADLILDALEYAGEHLPPLVSVSGGFDDVATSILQQFEAQAHVGITTSTNT